jgi:hypothetical protein
MTQGIARALIVGAMGLLCFHLGDDIGRIVERAFRSTDELAWISGNFGVGPVRLSEVRRLHTDFLTGHHRTVALLERDAAEFAHALDRAGHLTPELALKLEKLEQRRSHSHAEVLDHCLRVRALLEGEAGERYLHEMERVLLGLQARHHRTHAGDTLPREVANE